LPYHRPLALDEFPFLDDPETVVKDLKKCGKRIDLFTFMQGLPKAPPKYNYPMEWDNFAALPITTFEQWWTQVLGFKGRNKAKQAEKKGVKLREIPFDDVLLRGIWQIYNECPIRQGKRFARSRPSSTTSNTRCAAKVSVQMIWTVVQWKLRGMSS